MNHEETELAGNVLGDNNGNALLTEDDVRQIRGRFARKRGAPAPLIKQLAAEFNISTRQVRNVIYHRSWPHVS